MDGPGPPRRPPQLPSAGDSLDASNLELVLRALGAVAAADAGQPQRAAAEQRGPEFNWNEDEEAVPRTASGHKDGERSASRGPCKCGFKHWLKGIEYDWVIPIPTTAGMLLLGYNKSEDPYDAAERFIEQQKVRDSGLLDNSLVANLVEYILACTEAGDEPTYGTVPAPAMLAAPVTPAMAAAAVAPPSKEELEKREQERQKRDRELRAEKDRAEAQKLQVKKQIELDKENRRREAEARRKAEEERRAQAAQAPPPSATSSASSVVSQPSPPSSQPVSPAAPVQFSSTLHPVPQSGPSPWGDLDEDDEDDYAPPADLSRLQFRTPPPSAARVGGLGSIDRLASLRREQWTMEDVLQVYRTEGQIGLLTRLKKAGFSPDELIRLLQYAALMSSAEQLAPPAPSKSGSRSPEPRPFGGQGHTLRSSEPHAADAAFRGQGHSLRGSDPYASASPAPTPVSSVADVSAPSAAPAAGKAPEAVVVDPAQPKTSIKIRLHTGQQIVAHFNHTHTVLDIRRHIDFTSPAPIGAVYELLLPPPGRVVLADHSVTIAKAGLQNATVIQSLR